MPIKKIKQYAALRYQGDKTVQQRLELLYEQQIQLVKQKEEVEEHIRFLNEKIEVYKNMLKKNIYKLLSILEIRWIFKFRDIILDLELTPACNLNLSLMRRK